MDRYHKHIKYTLLIVIYILFAVLFWPFNQPIFFAALFALAFTPVVRRHNHRFKTENRMVLGLLATILLFFFLPIAWIVTSAVLRLKNIKFEQFNEMGLFQKFDSLLDSVTSSVQSLSETFGVDLSAQVNFKAIFSNATNSVFTFLTSVVTESPTFILYFLVFIIVLYYLLVRRKTIDTWFKELDILTGTQIDKLTKVLQETCYTVLVSSVFVAAVQAAIIAIACSITGYNEFLIVFMITFFTSFFPVVGSAPIPVVLALYSVLNGHIWQAVVLIAASLIAGTIDNIIRTYFLSGNEEETVHPLVSLLSLIGAISLFGIAGLFIGPIIAELAFRIKPILFEESKAAQSQNISDQA